MDIEKVIAKLKNSGFKVELQGMGVLVSLDNRKASSIEVKMALLDMVGIKFNSTFKGVMITG